MSNTGAHSDARELSRSVAQWAAVPTQFDSLSFYLAYVVYPDDIPVRRADTILSFLTGTLEMLRSVLILMTLSCIAQAARDRELSDRCTRMAGRLSFIPGILALAVFLYKVFMIETGAQGHGVAFFQVLLRIYLAIYVVPAAIQLLAMRTVNDVAEACEFPYQAEVDDLSTL